MSVCLAAMPWQSLESPSLPIGLLSAATVQAGLPRPRNYHGNLRWAEFLLAATDGEIGPPEYTDVAENGLFDGLGDWVFTGVLHGDEAFGVQILKEYAAGRTLDTSLIERMRGHAADFVDLAARELLDLAPTVVGFTSTFMQNVPSLATAKRLKELAPHVRIVFGGGNCDGPMGTAIHRNYPFVDFVVRGEGEVAWPMLLAALAGGGPLSQVPGLCWRAADGGQRRNDQAAPVLRDRYRPRSSATGSVKSNLKPSEIAVLRGSGVAHVQPGIESLVSPVLHIMDKGVTGVRNVRTLRGCESGGLTVT